VLQGDGYRHRSVVVSIDLSSANNATQSLEREPPTKLAVEIPDFPGFNHPESHFSGDTISIDFSDTKMNESIGRKCHQGMKRTL
jgi:hypothetical protein